MEDLILLVIVSVTLYPAIDMKLLVVISTYVVLCSSNANFAVPGDNRQYVEGKSRYIWIPDGNGVPHLVDLDTPVQENILKLRNGANNQYWLFTRDNPDDQQVIVQGDADSIWASNYLGSRPIKVIVHGWLSNGSSDMNPLITAAFLAVEDANVIVVDWRALAYYFYGTAVEAVPTIGQHIGNFLIWLIETAGGDWNSVHLVGFSLGAHIVGNAGCTANGWPGRVTGLDPAGPRWSTNMHALNSTAGQYVEVIHTDGGILGIFHPMADADFYPNGGKNPQPGCWINTCSHGRANELFAATVYHDHLVGRACSNVKEAKSSECFGEELNMGNDISEKRGKGIYGLNTEGTWPFCNIFSENITDS